ncbi:cytochrome c oxidase subunit 6b-1-like [Triticum urartu]|uniref:cytochrome c oxidase subunit 6b-1-like n=1 Tax=Triticum urartu TaxID=4572 RepID=UPI00204493D5|nr:cytochrome c oxidase subunit 6b-1-like [Triticum urartu]
MQSVTVLPHVIQSTDRPSEHRSEHRSEPAREDARQGRGESGPRGAGAEAAARARQRSRLAAAAYVELRTAPCDFRFPTQNQTRHCCVRYLEYHRCMKAKEGDTSECGKFQRYYRSLCPTDWVVEWNGNLICCIILGSE